MTDKMKGYRVVVPVSGYVTLDVQAESPLDAVKESAKELALRIVDMIAYDAQDASEVEQGLWVDNDDIQVTDLADIEFITNLSLIDSDVFHEITKNVVKR